MDGTAVVKRKPSILRMKTIFPWTMFFSSISNLILKYILTMPHFPIIYIYFIMYCFLFLLNTCQLPFKGELLNQCVSFIGYLRNYDPKLVNEFTKLFKHYISNHNKMSICFIKSAHD